MSPIGRNPDLDISLDHRRAVQQTLTGFLGLDLELMIAFDLVLPEDGSSASRKESCILLIPSPVQELTYRQEIDPSRLEQVLAFRLAQELLKTMGNFVSMCLDQEPMAVHQ
jgi:hypothetical protein